MGTRSGRIVEVSSAQRVCLPTGNRTHYAEAAQPHIFESSGVFTAALRGGSTARLCINERIAALAKWAASPSQQRRIMELGRVVEQPKRCNVYGWG